MNQLTFGAALERLKDGARIARAGWNGNGMFLFLVQGSNDLASVHKYGFGEYVGEPTFADTIFLRTTDNKLVSWTASQSDVLAADWLDLSPVPEGLAAYQCHKVVLAGCIHAIEQDGYEGGYCRLIFSPKDELAAEVGLAPEQMSIVVPASYVARCNPRVGGYYVLYSGGYESYSPAPEFINGYTRLPA